MGDAGAAVERGNGPLDAGELPFVHALSASAAQCDRRAPLKGAAGILRALAGIAEKGKKAA
jgi:hypothetical protein